MDTFITYFRGSGFRGGYLAKLSKTLERCVFFFFFLLFFALFLARDLFFFIPKNRQILGSSIISQNSCSPRRTMISTGGAFVYSTPKRLQRKQNYHHYEIEVDTYRVNLVFSTSFTSYKQSTTPTHPPNQNKKNPKDGRRARIYKG